MGRNSRIGKLSMFLLCFKSNCSYLIILVKNIYLCFALFTFMICWQSNLWCHKFLFCKWTFILMGSCIFPLFKICLVSFYFYMQNTHLHKHLIPHELGSSWTWTRWIKGCPSYSLNFSSLSRSILLHMFWTSPFNASLSFFALAVVIGPIGTSNGSLTWLRLVLGWSASNN
jgi:hypothetical protein